MPAQPAATFKDQPLTLAALPVLWADNTDPFFAAVAATPMPMAIIDCRRSDNPIVYVNDAFCQLTGYSRDEVIGRNCRFVQNPDFDGGALETIRQAVRTSTSVPRFGTGSGSGLCQVRTGRWCTSTPD